MRDSFREWGPTFWRCAATICQAAVFPWVSAGHLQSVAVVVLGACAILLGPRSAASARPAMRAGHRAPKPAPGALARSAAGCPADLRHAVPPGGGQRRQLRQLPDRDRLHAASLCPASSGPGTPQCGGVQRGHRPGHARARLPRRLGPQPVRPARRSGLRPPGTMRDARSAVVADRGLRGAAGRLSRPLPALGGRSQTFVAATDTIVRSFMGTFSALAKRYHLYMIGSADVAPFRQSRDRADLASFSDPDLQAAPELGVRGDRARGPQRGGDLGPARRPRRRSGCAAQRGGTNQKVPLTSLETFLGLAPGPAHGPAARANLRPYRLPGTHARLGIATSLPAFVYGSPPAGSRPVQRHLAVLHALPGPARARTS